MTTAVVTGGLGFIGSHLVSLLVEQGWEVVIIDNLATGDREKLNPSARLVEASITDPDAIAAPLQAADYVFHVAALPRIQPSFDDPVGHEEVNVVGTIRCLEALKGSRRLKKLVVSSSSASYGTATELPTSERAAISCLNPYALQKYASEQYALILGGRFDIPVVSLRYFNVYGPGSFNPKNPFNAYSSVIGVFHHQAGTGGPLTITGDGAQARDFVHVTDVARANLAAALSDRRGEVYNVGSGSSVSVKELAGMFHAPVTFIPERKGEAMTTWADVTKIKEQLGWTPQVSLEQGIATL